MKDEQEEKRDEGWNKTGQSVKRQTFSLLLVSNLSFTLTLAEPITDRDGDRGSGSSNVEVKACVTVDHPTIISNYRSRQLDENRIGLDLKPGVYG